MPPSSSRSPDAAVYEACDTLCLRPGDCEIAYSDDGYCPRGFRCARTYSCALDGGAD